MGNHALNLNQEPATEVVANALRLQIGGISLALYADGPTVILEPDNTKQRFRSNKATEDVALHCRWLSNDKLEFSDKIFDSGSNWQLFRSGRNFAFRLTSLSFGDRPYRWAIFGPDFSHGQILLHPHYYPPRVSFDPLGYPLDELLITNVLARGKGVEVHGCGLVDAQGLGHLFVGPSGAGKSTMAKQWMAQGEVTILSDDRIIIRKQRGRFYMHGTPWHGEIALSSPGSAPLSGIYFLSKADENRLIPQKTSAAITKLFACSFPPFYSQEGVNFTLSFLESIAQTIPCYELGFAPDLRVVDFIRNYGALS